ncbi:hypothetical protein [Marinobacter nauticus]|uniref:hypothetical protein n=1 Tax=Marinobacter nauticus TaxID=2743 RepID=UPI000EAF22C4|nr:hypothetical protein [Marinobacter nauticus]RKR70994.1 hypothetical protein C7436_3479 [Marinobacter nauticus]
MADVIHFKPRGQVSAEENVSAFIADVKRITAFDLPNYPLKWSAVNWTDWLKGAGFVKLGINAPRLRKNANPPLQDDEILDEKIIDFAKAYFLYHQAIQRTKSMLEIPVVRAIEVALLDLRGAADITLCNESVFDRAAEIAKAHFSEGRAYHIGGALQKLAAFLSEKKMVLAPLTWKNPISKQKDLSLNHQKRKEDADKKLPSTEVMDAIAEIFASRPIAIRDIVTTSTAAILLCAPARIGEVNEAVKAPFIEKITQDGKVEVFVKWHGEKGYGQHNKPIPETMVPVYKEAVRRIVEVTEDARALANWLEQNPDEFPPHPNCPKIEADALLTPLQALAALNLAEGRTAKTSLKQALKSRIALLKKSGGEARYPEAWKILNEGINSLEGIGRGDSSSTCNLTLRKLNTVLRQCWLPPSFPYVSDKKITKYSDALFCFFENALATSRNRPTQLYNLERFTSNTVNIDLTKVSEGRDYLNLFDRWGYVGDRYALTTHQFRHYINTIANKGHLGQLEIARWSGRADVSQNPVYNHMTPEEEVANMRRAGIGKETSVGVSNLATRSRNNQPILVSEVGGDTSRGDRIAHVTIYGRCEHDFSQEPCGKYRGCITCKKHKCIKGDEEKLLRIKFERDHIKVELDKAAAAANDGWDGADRWLEHKMKAYEAANQLISILENPEIEDGAVIRATDDGFTPLNRSIEMRGETKRSEKANLAAPQDKKAADLQRLRGILGR